MAEGNTSAYSTLLFFINVAGNHTAVLLEDGTVMTWGLNEVGQLGDGTRTNRNSPVTVNF